MLTFVYLTGTLFLSLSICWLTILTMCSWFYRPRKNHTAKLLRMAVIIPAHNEQASIVKTIHAVTASDYPKNMLQVIVIADNCHDNTALVARQSGALAFSRTDTEQRGKGQAIDWLLKSQHNLLGQFEALTFIDADAVPEPDMCRELSATLAVPGVFVAQGFSGVGNSRQNWRTALTAAAFNVFNHLRMAGNSVLCGSAMLKGLGMAFRTELLLNTGWPAHSVVEDLEFSILLARRKVKIHYNPEAIITSELAASRTQADSQRSRWEGGRLHLAAQQLPGLVRELLTGHWNRLHLVLDLVVPPLSMLVLCLGGWTLLAGVINPAALPFYFGLWFLLTGYVVSGQLQRRLPLQQWLYLCAAPAFIAWKFLLYLRMSGKKQTADWVRTLRHNELPDQQRNPQSVLRNRHSNQKITLPHQYTSGDLRGKRDKARSDSPTPSKS